MKFPYHLPPVPRFFNASLAANKTFPHQLPVTRFFNASPAANKTFAVMLVGLIAVPFFVWLFSMLPAGSLPPELEFKNLANMCIIANGTFLRRL